MCVCALRKEGACSGLAKQNSCLQTATALADKTHHTVTCFDMSLSSCSLSFPQPLFLYHPTRLLPPSLWICLPAAKDTMAVSVTRSYLYSSNYFKLTDGLLVLTETSNDNSNIKICIRDVYIEAPCRHKADSDGSHGLQNLDIHARPPKTYRTVYCTKHTHNGLVDFDKLKQVHPGIPSKLSSTADNTFAMLNLLISPKMVTTLRPY